MKEPTISKKILTVTLSVLFIGGLAAILGVYRTAKNALQPIDFV